VPLGITAMVILELSAAGFLAQDANNKARHTADNSNTNLRILKPP
jgi:hypothetical protein